MIRLRFSVILWTLLYIVIILAPLIGGIVNLAHGRGFLLNLSIGLGFIALSIFGAQFLLVARLRVVATPIGEDALLYLHRAMAWFGTFAALAHLIILLAIDKKYWALLDVTTSPLRAKFAVGATIALLLLIFTSAWRRKLKLNYRIWHSIHWILAMIIISAAMVHAVLVNNYLEDRLEQVIWLGLGAIFVIAAIWTRFILPLIRVRRKWKIDRIEHPLPDITSITLSTVRNKAYGQRGFRFKPGQFAWIIAGRSPFAITANPFTIASSAEKTDEIRFIIRAKDGYSASIRDLSEGDSVYLDGPHGTFIMDDNDDGPLVLIAAGIGITPFISMLETIADRDTKRPCHLWLANSDPQNVVGIDHIDAVKNRMDINISHFYSHVDPGHDNGLGRLSPEKIRAGLMKDYNAATFYICGGTGFMKMVNDALLDCGVHQRQIRYERFDMV